MKLKVKKMSPDAKLPSYGHKGDAGLDLFSSTDSVLEVGAVYAVPTGIKVEIPGGYVGLIWDKSGISLKGVQKLISVEMNSAGQMAKVLKSQGFKVDAKILKYSGRPFFVEEIEKRLKKII